MDRMLFPDEVLDLLGGAHFDPDADRGFEDRSSAFVWSDELLHKAQRSCSEQGSLADFYLLAFRGSLIRGQPIEEYRRPWDQLRAACPEWPGFRPERCSAELGRALVRERRLTHLLSAPGSMLLAVLIGSCLLPLVFALPLGVHVTASNLPKAPHSLWAWLGLGMQVAGILFLELWCRACKHVFRIEDKWRDGNDHRAVDRLWMQGSVLLAMQAITILEFALLMDGGVRFRACCWVYLIYAAVALLVLALRWKAWTRVEVLFLRWGWAPIIAFGIPLLFPTLKAMGLVRIIG